jgi:hypothetical protein
VGKPQHAAPVSSTVPCLHAPCLVRVCLHILPSLYTSLLPAYAGDPGNCWM